MSTFLRRSLTAAEMQARQLLRRRLSLCILVALPVALYLSTLTNGPESAIQFGALGMGWSIASAALFSVLAARAVEPRLVLAGYRPAELMVGRFLLLLAVGGVLASIGAVGMTLVSQPASEGALLAACALVPVVAVALGLAVGAVLPHDLEGVLVIIGVVGVQLSLNQSTWLNLLLPLDGPIQIAYRAGASWPARSARCCCIQLSRPWSCSPSRPWSGRARCGCTTHAPFPGGWSRRARRVAAGTASTRDTLLAAGAGAGAGPERAATAGGKAVLSLAASLSGGRRGLSPRQRARGPRRCSAPGSPARC